MTLLDDLRAALGAEQVLIDGDLSAWEIDWRRRYRGRALAVVRPADTAQVAAVVRACVRHGASLVPQGGNTGLVGGSVPDGSGTQVLLSLARLATIRAIDIDNLTITVDAGCVLQQVQQAASERGLLYPLSLAAEGSASIGGTLATNAGGTQVLRYGTARELCLGLEVVTATGDIWNGLTGLRKDNTGYDLRDLFIGSEGTLGVITGATLKLVPQPAAVCTAMAAVPTLEAAVQLLNLARKRLAAGLTGFEVMNGHALGLVRTRFPQWPQPLPPGPWAVLLEQSDTENEAHAQTVFESLLEAALNEGCISDAVVAASLEQSAAMWRLREGIPLAQAEEGLNIKHDIALPVSRIATFVQETDAVLSAAWPGHSPDAFFARWTGLGVYVEQNSQVAPRPAHSRARVSAHHLPRSSHCPVSRNAPLRFPPPPPRRDGSACPPRRPLGPARRRWMHSLTAVAVQRTYAHYRCKHRTRRRTRSTMRPSKPLSTACAIGAPSYGRAALRCSPLVHAAAADHGHAHTRTAASGR